MSLLLDNRLNNVHWRQIINLHYIIVIIVLLLYYIYMNITITQFMIIMIDDQLVHVQVCEII